MPSVTGALAQRRPPSPKRPRSEADDDRRQRALPLAEPGNDGETTIDAAEPCE